MTARQQQQTISRSGLNPQDQWVLLNSNVPLAVLNEHNQAQSQSESTALAARVAASLVTATAQAAAKAQAPVGKPTVSTPLQNSTSGGKLDAQQAATRDAIRNGASSRDLMEQNRDKLWNKIPVNPAKQDIPQATPPPSKTPPSNTPQGTYKPTGNIWQDLAHAISTLFPSLFPAEKPTATPPIQTPKPAEFWISTLPPTATPTPTPKPTLSLGEQRAQAAVKEGIRLADLGVKYTWGGKKVEDGLDCSGLVVILLKIAGFKVGQGYISKTAGGMVKSFNDHPEFGSPLYDYTKDSKMPPLQAGDLVFSANADHLTVNTHVMMATGNGLQVVEASSVTGVNKVTYQFDAYKTQKNGKYYRDSGQVVTYVIRPKY